MEIEDDKVWMTQEELDEFYDNQRITAIKLNAILLELCLLLLDKNKQI